MFVSNTWVNDIRVLEKALDIHNELSGKIWADKPIGPWVLQDMVQPIPPLYAKKGDERGGNVMGLDRFETDTLVCKLAQLCSTHLRLQSTRLL